MTGVNFFSAYAHVNGLKMYYEIHGVGKPLILLHGGFGSTGLLGPIVPALAQSRQVIVVDMQGHGRTADIDRPLWHEFLADDVAALIEHLGFEQADLMGYSLGGAVAFHTALRHPKAIRKLVIASFPFKWSAWYPETQAGFKGIGPASAEALKPSPLYQTYAAVAPNPEDWPALHDKYHLLLNTEYDWSSEVATITLPTMLVFADADAFSAASAVEFFELLGGGMRDGGWDGSNMPSARLAILPGTVHYNLLLSPLIANTVSVFLDEP